MDLLEQHAQALAKSVTSLLEGVATGAPAPAAAPNLEDALLEGADAPAPRGAIAWAEARAGEQPGAVASTPAEALLRADLEAVLRQRSQLRAKLVAETERREAAEAELVALGAQWLGTETQAALRRRAEQQDERRLNAHAAALAREAEQRVAQAQAETAVLRQRLGEEAPSPVQLRSQLRAATRAEVEIAQREARAEVAAELEAARARCDGLERELSEAEARHRSDTELLRQALRKADTLLQEQYDTGFVAGLKQAAEALGHGGGGGEAGGRGGGGVGGGGGGGGEAAAASEAAAAVGPARRESRGAGAAGQRLRRTDGTAIAIRM